MGIKKECCHCQVHQGSKCTFLVWDVNKTEHACVGAGIYVKSLHHSSYFDVSLNCSQNVCKRASILGERVEIFSIKKKRGSILKTEMQYAHFCTYIYTCPIKNTSLFDGCQKYSPTLTAYLLWHHDISIGKRGGVGSVKKARDSHLIPDNGGKTSPGIQPESSHI